VFKAGETRTIVVAVPDGRSWKLIIDCSRPSSVQGSPAYRRLAEANAWARSKIPVPLIFDLGWYHRQVHSPVFFPAERWPDGEIPYLRRTFDN
jgi:hypothetical protein